MSRFISVIMLVPLIAAIAGRAAEAPPLKFWIFLTTGKPTTGVPTEEIRAKQASHIANFRRLAELKLLLAAGPMDDPAGVLRGIVVLSGNDPLQLAEYFVPDPYVSEGFMKTEVNPVEEMDGAFALPVDPAGMEELRIAVWDRENTDRISQAELAAAIETHRDYWKKQRTAGRLAVRCLFRADAPRFGIAILSSAGEDQVRQWLDEDPLVRQKVIRYQVMPQYLAKGVVSFEE
jgi:uncharacterized protein YciI